MASTGQNELNISVKPCKASNSELQAFIQATWEQAYSGRMSFPIWTTEYFNWQLKPRPGGPERRLVAYDNDKLVAALLGRPATFEIDGNKIKGAHWSWLSVVESYRGRGLAKSLDEARVQVEREAGSDLIVSYRFTGSKHSLAERPSKRNPLKDFSRRLGFWARPLDPARLRRWNLNRIEGFMGQIVAPLLPKTVSLPHDGIRIFERDDLQECVQLSDKQFENCVLRIQWNEWTLEHQLAGSPLSQTVVAEWNGEVRGFVNFHVLPFEGATREPMAVIDLICVNQLPRHLQKTLMLSALALMRQQGAILALKLRSGDISAKLMLSTGFIPRLPDSSLVLQWTHQKLSIPKNQPIHLLWR